MDEQFKQTIMPTAMPDSHLDTSLGEPEEVQSMLMMYTGVIREVKTKLEVLNDELNIKNQRNPIEFIETRVKTPQSIAKKLKRRNLPVDIDSAKKHLNDIAGIRVICSFTTDIYRLAEMIRNQRDIHVISVKDYIKNPKSSGYTSYHMIVQVPVYLSDKIVETKVEIQIRTVAMDFWATLEHKINYKFEGQVPEHIREELVECAELVTALDNRMLELNEEIKSL